MSDAHLAPSMRLIQYVANGIATEFTIPFIIWDKTEIGVYIDGSKVSPVFYSVTNTGEMAGANLIFVVAPIEGSQVTIAGETPRERAADYNEYATLRASVMNLDENYQEVQIQENTRDIIRSLKTPIEDGIAERPMDVPNRDARKDSYLAFDDEGYPIAVGDAANVVKGLKGTGSTPNAVMIWADDTGLQAGDSHRVFGAPNGAATLDGDAKLSIAELPTFTVSNLGVGVDVVTQFSGPTELQARRIQSGTRIDLVTLNDGSLEISCDLTPLTYRDEFAVADWSNPSSSTWTLTYAADEHKAGETDGLVVEVRDTEGNKLECDIQIATNGTVIVTSRLPFAGITLISALFGGDSSHSLINPMRNTGDMIYSIDDFGSADRLPIGSEKQLLGVSSLATPTYYTVGDAAWLGINAAGGVPVLDSSGRLVVGQMPVNSMRFLGSFGTSGSTTGGDLPASGSISGDAFVCVATDPFVSTVAGQTFISGQWAIFDGTSWFATPSATSDPLKADRDAANLTATDVTAWKAKLYGDIPAPRLNANAGYRHNTDGTIEQWGKASGTDPVVFPKAFPTAVLNIQATSREDSSRSVIIYEGSYTRTQFSYGMRSNSFSRGPIFWRAIGY